MAELPGKELAQELIQKSREESRRTPMEAVIQMAKDGRFHEEEGFRLIGQLWTLEPGDVISCGTNHQGLGPVQDGERVEIEVEGVGRMAVKVQDPLKRSWPKEIDEDMARFVREWRQNPSTPPPRAMTPRR